MKAMMRDRFGGPEVLELREVEPQTRGQDEVLVRVHASRVSVGDWFWLTGTPAIMRPASGILRPGDRVLGRDLAGVVEAVGVNVTTFEPGDEAGLVPTGLGSRHSVRPGGAPGASSKRSWTSKPKAR